jgi:hypothetical protein
MNEERAVRFYDNWNISMVIYDTDISWRQPSHDGYRKTLEVMIST